MPAIAIMIIISFIGIVLYLRTNRAIVHLFLKTGQSGLTNKNAVPDLIWDGSEKLMNRSER